MKEFDFDELDRAVTNLMGNVPGDDTQNNNVAATTSTPSTTPSVDTAKAENKDDSVGAETHSIDAGKDKTSELDKPVSDSGDTAESDKKPVASVTPRRSGRFMDVMHPSADMKTSDNKPTVPSREGKTLAPVGKSEVSEAPKPVQPVVDETVVSTQLTDDEGKQDWPDPIDQADKNEATAPDDKKSLVDLSSESDDLDADKNTIDETLSPTSPFLADAKVEKRPLGGMADDISESFMSAAGESQADKDTSVPTEPVAPELDNKLMAIESGSDSSDTSSDAEQKPAATTTEEFPASSPDVTRPPQPTAPKGPVAIQPQYKEEPSTGDQKNGAIFDTDTYHKPLEHPAKKKSGWLWVVLIIGLIALGSGLGAAAYFMGILSYL